MNSTTGRSGVPFPTELMLRARKPRTNFSTRSGECLQKFWTGSVRCCSTRFSRRNAREPHRGHDPIEAAYDGGGPYFWPLVSHSLALDSPELEPIAVDAGTGLSDPGWYWQRTIAEQNLI